MTHITQEMRGSLNRINAIEQEIYKLRAEQLQLAAPIVEAAKQSSNRNFLVDLEDAMVNSPVKWTIRDIIRIKLD